MSRVLLNGQPMTREAMIKALAADHGVAGMQARVRGRTCPLFDVADELQHEDARRIYGWLKPRLRSIQPELKFAAVPPAPTTFSELAGG